MGCSPYFIVTGAEPILPLDIVESTWLVKPPDRVLTLEELLGFRAQALAKHRTHVNEMRERVDENKRIALIKFEKEFGNTIRDYDFKPGTLVQVRNTQIEKSLDRKMYPRYKGPMIVIRRTKGGSYVIAEMDGSVLKEKVAAFRVLPHAARYEPIQLPENIHDLIDLDSEQLEAMIEEDNENPKNADFIFDAIPNLRLDGEDSDAEDNDSQLGDDLDENEEPDWDDRIIKTRSKTKT